ncbi:MAG: hypothetical protein ACPF9D_08175, partial [Owenweeksia sp.]
MTNLLILTVLFLLLFAAAEILHKVFKWKAENSRKFIHISVGLLALSFPMFFDVLWPVLLLCGGFFILLVLSRSFHFLPSVNGVKRKTEGSLLFPVMVALCFWVGLHYGDMLYFWLPIGLLAICDPLAAHMGNAKAENKKSMRGFYAFLLSAFVITSAYLVYIQSWDWQPSLILGLIMALVTALAEYFPRRGWDNATIPLAAMTVLLTAENFR